MRENRGGRCLQPAPYRRPAALPLDPVEPGSPARRSNQHDGEGDPESKKWLSQHWFLPVAFALAVGDLSSVYFAGWTDAEVLEAALLFDFVVVIPGLYWWCYRRQGRAAIIKAAALACLAIWCTGKIVPPEHQNLLDSIGWLRYVGLAGLLALEIKLGFMVYRAVIFSGQSKGEAQETFESEGMPPWIARLMAFEASLWRKAWLFVQRVFRGKSQ